jgi:hypothetical protein
VDPPLGGGLIIVANRLLIPAFQRDYKQRPEMRRLVVLSLDTELDVLRREE